ncbi:Oxidoreductase [Alteracholeplasma palmae J233]|uniref:Oxidoreductase n=1 Tax=Alteracholeplasma palmae (strain ATCC 49389 / J233) TaxID=1318466 RepID=U4KL90_ALTPJ|nr:Gfo/Idh/MocA family oxidoreductase [Alteracholeplasma palmae]CCV64552.1 Oxidoreductase [Alteracholeplasma palmae J233]
MSKKKYVIVGVGGRSRMFYEAIATTYKETSELLAICDMSQTRMDFTNKALKELGYQEVKTYHYLDFDKMLDELKPDYVIVTSIDRTHHDYIIRSMRKGCDVVTEKPMTIDAEKIQEILDVQKETGRNIKVTFNYRYSPNNTKVRELISTGVIGQVFSVHFEWLLNTQHGADYYRRWHRNKVNSGGLLVHKSTHHFDLVNFWLNANPKRVFAFGERNFYGKENAEKRGITKFYDRCHGNVTPEEDPFAIDLESNETLKGLYLDAEKDSGYIRDRSVFADDISIEDTMGVIVQYDSKAILTYSLNSYMPWEGYNVSINGSKGRIEYNVIEKSYINAGGEKSDEGATLKKQIIVHPMFGKPYEVHFVEGKGGHGGGDNVMLDFIFGEPKEDSFNRSANQIDGAKSVLTGVAANKAIASGEVVEIDSLVKF